MHTYAARFVADQVTGRALAGVRVAVEDAETGLPVQAYRDGVPVSLVTGAHGLIPEWQTEKSTRRVTLTAGSVRLTRWCEEIIGASGRAIAELERLTISHVAFDTDGVPAIVQGSASARIIYDTDGVPAVISTQEA